MGTFLSKQLIFQGFYYDMIVGFPTKAGGTPTMIAYPDGLRDLPEECPKCHSGSGLRWVAMNAALHVQRRAFIDYAEAVFTQRLAKGEADPYNGFETCTRADLAAERAEEKLLKRKQQNQTAMAPSTPPTGKTPTLMKYLKRNEVSPDQEGLLAKKKEKGDYVGTYVGFEVDRNALAICDCNIEDQFQGKGYIRQFEQEVEEEQARKKRKKLEKQLGMENRAQADLGAGGDQKPLLDVGSAKTKGV